MSDINKILGLLQKVKSKGSGKWAACCPVHDDNNPSMSVSVAGDGETILLHCFGCGAGAMEIMEVLGLDSADLFRDKPERGNVIDFPHTKPTRQPFTDSQKLECIGYESSFVEVMAAAMVRGEFIGQNDINRLRLANERISEARYYAR